MNAVAYFAHQLPAEAVRRLAALRVRRFDASGAVAARGLDVDEARERVVARWQSDLCGFLNALTRGELALLAINLGRALHELDGISSTTGSAAYRERLWQCGADLERQGCEIDPRVQPRPVVLGGHLVVQAAPRGLHPPSATWPRVVPSPRVAQLPSEEPDTVDELLAAADRALGVRLGRRGRDKGAWGLRAATLLGVVERGGDEPDWRGDVEIKTVPIAREPSGLWRIVEDPAIAMLDETGALAKLQRTLWLARADVEDGDATLVSWYLLE